MQTPFIGHKIIHLERVGSTNNYAAKLFRENEISSGAVILADEQTNGRGQRQKTWQSDAFANLTVSFVGDLNTWKINQLTSLNHIVALAVTHFIQKYTENVAIKWPNDIMVDGKKIAGILIENQLSQSSRKTVIGCGININQDQFDYPRATSLFLKIEKKVAPKTLLPELIQSLNQAIENYQLKGEIASYKAFNSALWKKNSAHIFYVEDIERQGELLSTTMAGQLIVNFNGKEEQFSNGEIRY